MRRQWIWWIAAALLIGAELLTGTFYLLAVGIAVAIGGVAAWLGARLAHPVRRRRRAGGRADDRWRTTGGSPRRPPPPQPSLDVGQAVHVATWNADGTARVAYRGSTWDAELAAPDVPRAETLYIVATRGSVLVLSDRRPAA